MTATATTRAAPDADLQGRFRVEIADGAAGCGHCGAGAMYTVVYNDVDGEECQISTSYQEREVAESICEVMNIAYELGFDVREQGQ